MPFFWMGKRDLTVVQSLILNNLRRMPRRALGDFQTTMFIQKLLSIACSRQGRTQSAKMPPAASAPLRGKWQRLRSRLPAPPHRHPVSSRLWDLPGTYAPPPLLRLPADPENQAAPLSAEYLRREMRPFKARRLYQYIAAGRPWCGTEKRLPDRYAAWKSFSMNAK